MSTLSGVIAAVAFCPHPPALVPQVAQGAASDLAELRETCRRAIRTVATASRQVVLLGGGPRSFACASSARGSLARYGVPTGVSLGAPGHDPVDLPLSLTVGAWLVRVSLGEVSARAFTVGPDWMDSAAAAEWNALSMSDTEIALIVLGDGSGWRGETTADRLGERAAAFDGDVSAALASGDPARLAVDSDDADALLVGGVAAWHAVGLVLAGRQWEASLDFDAAPFGVGYFVATWT